MTNEERIKWLRKNGFTQKNNESYYTQLRLTKIVLTAVEYIDIMKRL